MIKLVKKMKKLVLIMFVLIFCVCQAVTPASILNIELKDTTPKIENYQLSMAMVGDVLLHDGVYKDAYNSTTKKYDFSKHVELIKPITSMYDVAFYNQETILGGTSLGLSTYPRFNSPFEIGDAMIDAGFNMVSLANNHTLDRGEEAILNSNNYWQKQVQVYSSGSYDSKESRNEIPIFEKNNITYAMLAYTTTTNGLKTAENKEYLVDVYEEEKVAQDVKNIRDEVDVLFISMHWGNEYETTPNKTQQGIANYLSTLNVDVVIGHHPHVVQPIELVGNTLVFYSLGNFISAQDSKGDYQKRIGLLSSLDIYKSVQNGEKKIRIQNVENELLYTHYENYRNFKVIPFRNMNVTYNKEYQRLYDKYSNIIKQIDVTVPIRSL